MGLPAEKAQYIHRVGRTARAGKRGRGVLLLSDFEAPYFLHQLRDVNISKAPPLPQAAVPALQVWQVFNGVGCWMYSIRWHVLFFTRRGRGFVGAQCLFSPGWVALLSSAYQATHGSFSKGFGRPQRPWPLSTASSRIGYTLYLCLYPVPSDGFLSPPSPLVVQALVVRGLQATPLETKERAYATWLGFYKGFTSKLGWDSAELVQAANYFSTVIGAPVAQQGSGEGGVV